MAVGRIGRSASSSGTIRRTKCVTRTPADHYPIDPDVIASAAGAFASGSAADPDGVVDVRGKGLMLAVEHESKDRRDDVMAAAVDRGFLTLGCGHRTQRFLPPLDVTEREIDLGVDLLLEAIEAA